MSGIVRKVGLLEIVVLSVRTFWCMLFTASHQEQSMYRIWVGRQENLTETRLQQDAEDVGSGDGWFQSSDIEERHQILPMTFCRLLTARENKPTLIAFGAGGVGVGVGWVFAPPPNRPYTGSNKRNSFHLRSVSFFRNISNSLSSLFRKLIQFLIEIHSTPHVVSSCYNSALLSQRESRGLWKWSVPLNFLLMIQPKIDINQAVTRAQQPRPRSAVSQRLCHSSNMYSPLRQVPHKVLNIYICSLICN
jgi:hypothetical protein